MTHSPKFSVIMVDYEGSVPDETLCRGIQCFKDQSFQDFELLVYHDGPRSRPYEDIIPSNCLPQNVQFTCSPERRNDWGHSNRNSGIFDARGDWIIHTNADNIFYPDALQKLANTIDSESWALAGRKSPSLNWDAVIFPIIMVGYATYKTRLIRVPEHDEKLRLVLSGNPPLSGHIDIMQFVMRREKWLEFGGWKDKRKSSDGFMIKRFAEKIAIHNMTEILGEHW